MSLRATQKLFLGSLALIAAVVLALTIGVRTTLRDHLLRIAMDDLRRELDVARAYAATAANPEPESLALRLNRLVRRRVTIIAADGRVLGDSDLPSTRLPRLENHASRPEVRAALAGRVGVATRRSRTFGKSELYMAAPSRGGTVLRLAFPLSQSEAALASAQLGIFGVGLLAALATALLSFGFSMAVTRPLRGIAATARGMARGDLSLRVCRSHRDELGELGDALDALAAQLQRRLAQLEDERAEMQALIDTMAEGVVAFSADGRVRRANPAARAFLSLPPEPRGLPPEAVTRRPAFLALVRRALGGEAVAASEFAARGRRLLLTAQPLTEGGAVVVLLDVSPLRRLEGVRRDFVANASHELKTPLTAIRGYAETLLDPELPPELRAQFIRTVKANADRLHRIVEDLLDLSRIESGGWRAEPRALALAEVIDEAWAPCAEAARGRGVRFDLDLRPGAERVHADPAALRQVLANLFSNSLRYVGDGGSIRVEARPLSPAEGSEPAARGWIRVAVRDDGCGIPAAHLPRIFERFYRVDAARSRAAGGTGLGLAIARHLIERHGGTITAESTLGLGTAISFTLPAPSPADA